MLTYKPAPDKLNATSFRSQLYIIWRHSMPIFISQRLPQQKSLFARSRAKEMQGAPPKLETDKQWCDLDTFTVHQEPAYPKNIICRFVAQAADIFHARHML